MPMKLYHIRLGTANIMLSLPLNSDVVSYMASSEQKLGKILRTLCERKGVEILEANACPDHIHMLLQIPPKYSVSEVIGFLKGKSSLMIFDRFANLKYRYGNRKFWSRGYYVDTVGRNEKKITEYIHNQLQEDKLTDQLTLKELEDPFTGESVREGK